MLVPVVNKRGEPLMPCRPALARKMIAEGKATPFFKKGFFAIRLNYGSSGYKQAVLLGIDTGSKRTGMTVATEQKSVLHLQSDAPIWVKKKVETRGNLRTTRRGDCPSRLHKQNKKRNKKFVAPSSRARWGAHLRLLCVLLKIIPITDVAIEDIKAKTRKNHPPKAGAKKGQTSKNWNENFSPLEVGKKYFESEIKKLGLNLYKFAGYETFEHRKLHGYKKSTKKLSDDFSAHCVDSFSLCEMINGWQLELTSKKIYKITLLEFFTRQLHVQNPIKGGVRKNLGSTRSMGLNRGTLIEHPKYGRAYVGGTSNDRISLHSQQTGKRLAQNIKVEDCKILTNQSWTNNLI